MTNTGYVAARYRVDGNRTTLINTGGWGFQVLDVGDAIGHTWILPSFTENPPPAEDRFGLYAQRAFPGLLHRGQFGRLWISTDTDDPTEIVLRIFTDPRSVPLGGPWVSGKQTLMYTTADITLSAGSAPFNLIASGASSSLVRSGIAALGLGDRNAPNELASDAARFWDGWVSADQIFSLVVAARELQDDVNTGWRTVQRFDSSGHAVFGWNTPGGVTAEELVDLGNGTGFYPFDTGTFQRNYIASRVTIPPGRLRLYIDWDDAMVGLTFRCNIGARAS